MQTADGDQRCRWREHFSHGNKLDNVEPATQYADGKEVSPPSTREFLEAIVRLKAGKSAGDDGVPAELFHVDP